MANGRRFVQAADTSLRETYESPLSLEDFVDELFENPAIASHASRHLLRAIESTGTRTVVEHGEEHTRYRFFDDPYNDGEHAILGNTEVLNGFVDDLRTIAAGRGKTESIIWFSGPTATGKSELKRCLINGLREYSKSPEGRRYTIEWNITPPPDPHGLSYGSDASDDHWFESPVQANPLCVFPADVRADIVKALNERLPGEIGIRLDEDLDPFSREAYQILERRYRRKGERGLFTAITNEQNCRVKNYVVDIGHGIGVLHADDDGHPKQRLVGSWMAEMLRALDSRGRKNPQAFSYDGVLSQGNTGLTIVEDASQHADLLQKLLNVPDEGTVKLDKSIQMDVDTQLIIFSNPDLEDQLNQHADRRGRDPLKALKRRLDKREFTYLTNLSLEVQLLHRELRDDHPVWEDTEYDTIDDRIRAPLILAQQDTSGHEIDREFPPHAIEAAALYDIVTRLDPDDIPAGLGFTDKALLLDRGYLQKNGERLDMDDFEFSPDSADGHHGIPVTYTRDILADLVTAETDREHPDLPVDTVIMPSDVLDAMAEGLRDAPVFGATERGEYENRVVPVKEYIRTRQETDVLDALLAPHRADEESTAEYLEHVYAWATDDTLESDHGEPVDPDPLVMKVFEVEHLGQFEDHDYDGTTPSEDVATFRRDTIMTALNRHAWQHRTEDYTAGDLDFTTIPVLRDVLDLNTWADVKRLYEDFDPRQWADPPSGTITARLKTETLDRMCNAEYTPASAELTSQRVMDHVSHQWD